MKYLFYTSVGTSHLSTKVTRIQQKSLILLATYWHQPFNQALSDNDRLDPLNFRSVAETKSSLDHLLRILTEKSGVFRIENAKRFKVRKVSFEMSGWVLLISVYTKS